MFVLHFLFASVRVCALRTVVLDSDSARPGLHVRLSPRTIPFFFSAKTAADRSSGRASVFSSLLRGRKSCGSACTDAQKSLSEFQTFSPAEGEARRDETGTEESRLPARPRLDDEACRFGALLIFTNLYPRIFSRDHKSIHSPHTLYRKKTMPRHALLILKQKRRAAAGPKLKLISVEILRRIVSDQRRRREQLVQVFEPFASTVRAYRPAFSSDRTAAETERGRHRNCHMHAETFTGRG